MKVQREFEVKPTPHELAGEFCEMDAAKQASFFAEVVRLSSAWDRDPTFQWYSIGEALADGGPELRAEMRSMIHNIAEALDD